MEETGNGAQAEGYGGNVEHQVQAGQKGWRKDCEADKRHLQPAGKAAEQSMQGKNEKQAEWHQPEFPEKRLLSEEHDRGGPPVRQERWGQDVGGRLPPFVTENNEGITIEPLMRCLFCR